MDDLNGKRVFTADEQSYRRVLGDHADKHRRGLRGIVDLVLSSHNGTSQPVGDDRHRTAAGGMAHGQIGISPRLADHEPDQRHGARRCHVGDEAHEQSEQICGQIVTLARALEGVQVCDILLQQLGQEVELAPELPIDGLLGHSGRLGDRVHCRLFRRSVEKDPSRR